MEELIPINIVIADRNYRIKITAADEEHVRKTIKTINEKVLDFKTNFAGKDMQDYVSMVLIWYATQITSTKEFPGVESAQFLTALQKLDEQITGMLPEGV